MLLAAADQTLPDRDAARRLAADELAKPEYEPARKSLWDLFLEWLSRLLDSAAGASATMSPWIPLFAVLGVILVIGLAYLAGQNLSRTAARRRLAAADQLADVTAEELAERGKGAAAEQNWHDAVVWYFRAILRHLRDSRLVPLSDAYTSAQLTSQVHTAGLGVADDIDAATAIFDQVVYGQRRATEAHCERVQRAYQRLADGGHGASNQSSTPTTWRVPT